MIAYKSNSPQYLDYIAANKTRQQIKDDPKLCVLLENEYIKDNMELAIRWYEAKYGNYQAKYDFAEYLMCNGPEVDADTILHYRTMALRDPVMVEIAYTYLTDVNTLVKLRKEKYGKDSDDCFTNPCFYLGRFSAAIGEEGDVKKTDTHYNWIGSALKNIFDIKAEAKDEEDKKKLGLTQSSPAKKVGDKVQQASTAAASAVSGSSDTPKPQQVTDSNGQVNANSLGSQAIGNTAAQGVIPIQDIIGGDIISSAICQNDKRIFQRLTAQNLGALVMAQFGDWKSKAVQKFLSLNSAANVKRRMGDCSRLWQQVRQVRLFDKQNAFGPMTPDMKLSGINANGMYTTLYGKSDPSAADVWKRLWQTNSIAEDIKNARKNGVQNPTTNTGNANPTQTVSPKTNPPSGDNKKK